VKYKVIVTRVQEAERFVRATAEDDAAAQVQAEFDRPYGYFGSWKTTSSEIDVIEAEQTTVIGPKALSNEGPLLLPLKDAAKALGISYSTIYQLVNPGDIEHVVIGTRRSSSPERRCSVSSKRTHSAATSEPGRYGRSITPRIFAIYALCLGHPSGDFEGSRALAAGLAHLPVMDDKIHDDDTAGCQSPQLKLIEQVLSLSELCAHLQVSAQTIYDLRGQRLRPARRPRARAAARVSPVPSPTVRCVTSERCSSASSLAPEIRALRPSDTEDSPHGPLLGDMPG
jgi:excisionase family DNA binding protein